MTESPSAAAQRLLVQAADALLEAASSGSDAELVALLSTCESVVRRLDRATVDAVAALDRRGVFAEHGYRSPVQALSDLLGWERFEARRRVVAAEQVTPRTGLDGAVLSARLAATAEVFADGRTGLRHVEVIARVLASKPAGRLSPEVWAGAEAQLAGKADVYTPTELQQWGTALVELLDQDGEQPDDRPPARVNELFLTRLPGGGGKVKGRFDDAAMFDAIAAVIDAHATPLTRDDDRTAGERQAEALADVCGYVLDHAPSSVLPDAGGHRPHVNVLIRLEDLEKRGDETGASRSAERPSPVPRFLPPGPGRVPGLRRPGRAGVAADAVLRRRRHPGRAERQGPAPRRRPGHPHHPRRAPPGGGRPGPRMRAPRLRPAMSWTHCHHIVPWELGGETKLSNLAMYACRVHHRQIHSTEFTWVVRIRDGLPEFIPPKWLDFEQSPRRRALPHLAAS